MTYSNLLPAEFAEPRSAVLVADSLRIPTHPFPLTAVQPGQLNSAEELHALSRVLGQESVPGIDTEEQLTFVDKANPHAVHDLMLISGGDVVISNVFAHSGPFISGVMGAIAGFARSAKAQGLTPVVSWSYDPDTVDRASGQGEKRFHAHFVGRTSTEVARVHEIEKPLGELSRVRQRRIADEFSLVGGYAMADALQDEALDGLTVMPPFSTPQSKLCLQFEVDGGWDSFADQAQVVGDGLKKIDAVYHTLFRRFVAELTDGRFGQWERPVLVDNAAERVTELADGMKLSPEAAKLLGHYVANLHPSLLEPAYTGRFTQNPDSDWCTYLYPLGGPSYTTCITEVDGIVKGHIRPNMFTDLGGAGVALVDGVMTKVKKTDIPMSASEYQSRRDFQERVLTEVGVR